MGCGCGWGGLGWGGVCALGAAAARQLGVAGLGSAGLVACSSLGWHTGKPAAAATPPPLAHRSLPLPSESTPVPLGPACPKHTCFQASMAVGLAPGTPPGMHIASLMLMGNASSPSSPSAPPARCAPPAAEVPTPSPARRQQGGRQRGWPGLLQAGVAWKGGAQQCAECTRGALRHPPSRCHLLRGAGPTPCPRPQTPPPRPQPPQRSPSPGPPPPPQATTPRSAHRPLPALPPAPPAPPDRPPPRVAGSCTWHGGRGWRARPRRTPAPPPPPCQTCPATCGSARGPRAGGVVSEAWDGAQGGAGTQRREERGRGAPGVLEACRQSLSVLKLEGTRDLSADPLRNMGGLNHGLCLVDSTSVRPTHQRTTATAAHGCWRGGRQGQAAGAPRQRGSQHQHQQQRSAAQRGTASVSHLLAPTVGSRISAAHLPQGRCRTPR